MDVNTLYLTILSEIKRRHESLQRQHQRFAAYEAMNDKDLQRLMCLFETGMTTEEAAPLSNDEVFDVYRQYVVVGDAKQTETFKRWMRRLLQTLGHVWANGRLDAAVFSDAVVALGEHLLAPLTRATTFDPGSSDDADALCKAITTLMTVVTPPSPS
jgi:hypothetical protein